MRSCNGLSHSQFILVGGCLRGYHAINIWSQHWNETSAIEMLLTDLIVSCAFPRQHLCNLYGIIIGLRQRDRISTIETQPRNLAVATIQASISANPELVPSDISIETVLIPLRYSLLTQASQVVRLSISVTPELLSPHSNKEKTLAPLGYDLLTWPFHAHKMVTSPWNLNCYHKPSTLKHDRVPSRYNLRT